MMEHLAQILVLLGVAVAIVLVFQRLHVPTSLGYLLVGVILGPYTSGPTVYVPEFKVLAEFGVVFLLFTIGLTSRCRSCTPCGIRCSGWAPRRWR